MAVEPRIVGHRGLIHDAPENSLAGFTACLELRIGFEVDVRRSKDGVLVCVHDATLARTTNGKGKVADFTLAELKQLDAGSWLHPSFSAEKVPTLDEVLRLVKGRGRAALVALDLKVTDATLAADVAALTRKHGVSKNCLCIGLAISDAGLRKALRQSDPKLKIAALAQKAEDFSNALADEAADWVYVRFLPTREHSEQAKKAKKQTIAVGPLVMGREPVNWNRARAAGVDALLTDFPLECRQSWRKPVE
jgi:glycerophosphoryl diester phosphodiesterase